MKCTVDGQEFEIPDGWYLGYLVECTPSGYYWPPLTYYGPKKGMWRAYETRKYLLKFITLGHCDPRKGKNMNENIVATNKNMVEAYSALDSVEILDADGNPTGAYKPRSDGEAAREETTIFAAEDDSDGHVIVH